MLPAPRRVEPRRQRLQEPGLLLRPGSRFRSACNRAFVQLRPVTVGERGHRRGRRKHRRDPTGRPRDRVRPAVEAEPQQAVVEDQSWGTVGVDHYCTGGQLIERGWPDDAIRRPRQASAATVPLGLQPLVQIRCRHRLRSAEVQADRISIGVVVATPAGRARPVAGREPDRVIEEEQRRPPSRAREGDTPPSKLSQADDPE